jgi:hypothetical protein
MVSDEFQSMLGKLAFHVTRLEQENKMLRGAISEMVGTAQSGLAADGKNDAYNRRGCLYQVIKIGRKSFDNCEKDV